MVSERPQELPESSVDRLSVGAGAGGAGKGEPHGFISEAGLLTWTPAAAAAAASGEAGMPAAAAASTTTSMAEVGSARSTKSRRLRG